MEIHMFVKHAVESFYF